MASGQNSHNTFIDNRGRTWEWFIDRSYYDCTCVRPVGTTDFNDEMSFHFSTSTTADEFIALLKVSM